MRTVLVTGGTRGIGLGIARAFAAEGDTVVVTGRKERELDLPFPVLFGDVRKPEDVERIVQATIADHGGLHVLINNAGGSPPADTAEASARFTEAIIRLNLTAPLLLAQAANRWMQSTVGGVIVNVCSVSGLRASPNTAAYGAAKAGLLNLTKTLAVEWAPLVRVNAVTPGLIATEQADLFYPDRAAVEDTVPLARLGTPEDVAHACVFLASAEASYISGANLVLDGGGEWPAYLLRGKK